MNSILHPLENQLLKALEMRPWTLIYIAYSGGMDSSVLLRLSVALRERKLLKTPLYAWHINHQILPQANAWEKHCRNQCAALGVPLRVSRLEPDKRKGESTEMSARRRRYDLWGRELTRDALLLQAHHQRDQAETLLLRVVRGSRNLHGMPNQRQLRKAWLWRPLLESPHSELLAYQQERSIPYIKDPSNENLQPDRNFIRHRILKSLTQRWPSVQEKIAHSATRLSVHTQALSLFKESLLKQHSQNNRLGISAFARLQPAVVELLIEAWLEKLQLSAAPPAVIREVIRQARARPDANPCLRWQGAEIHRYGSYLYAMPVLPSIGNSFVIELKEPNDTRRYKLGLGKLVLSPTTNNGFSPKTRKMSVRYRQGGEKIRLQQQQHSIKKILQRKHVPPWLRAHIPLLYCEEQLAVLPDICVAQEFSMKEGNGLKAHWELDPLYGSTLNK